MPCICVTLMNNTFKKSLTGSESKCVLKPSDPAPVHVYLGEMKMRIVGRERERAAAFVRCILMKYASCVFDPSISREP